MPSNKPRPMTAKQLRQFRQSEFGGISQAEMADKLGITLRAYSRYETDKRTIPLPIAELVRCLASKM